MPHLKKQDISRAKPAPLYQQIYLLFRDRIEAGTLAFDCQLPTEEQLASQLAVSRITIKRAMNELASNGYVTRSPRTGTRVTFSATPPVRGGYTTPMEHLRRLGFSTDVKLRKIEYIKADARIAGALFVPLGTPIQRVERVRYLEGAPFSQVENHTPADIARQIPEEQLEQRAFTAMLADAGYKIASVDQTILARVAEGEMARALMLANGAPVLTIQRALHDAAGRTIQFTVVNYRADRYQYHMNMSDLATLTPAE